MQIQELNLLLKQSITWNKNNALSGLLCYIEGNFPTHTEARFIQVLEGTKQDVEYIFERIKNDDRHHDVTLLKKEPLEERNFKDWHMALERVDLKQHEGLQAFFELNKEILNSQDFKQSDAMLNFLKSFYNDHTPVKFQFFYN